MNSGTRLAHALLSSCPCCGGAPAEPMLGHHRERVSQQILPDGPRPFSWNACDLGQEWEANKKTRPSQVSIRQLTLEISSPFFPGSFTRKHTNFRLLSGSGGMGASETLFLVMPGKVFLLLLCGHFEFTSWLPRKLSRNKRMDLERLMKAKHHSHAWNLPPSLLIGFAELIRLFRVHACLEGFRVQDVGATLCNTRACGK